MSSLLANPESLILLTRPQSQSLTTAAKLEKLGFATKIIPTISIRELELTKEGSANLQKLQEGKFQALAFCSAQAVRYFCRVVRGSSFPDIPIYAVGPKTKEAVKKKLSREGVLSPSKGTAVELALLISKDLEQRATVLVPGPLDPRPELDAILKEAGIIVQRLDLYVTEEVSSCSVEDLEISSDREVVIPFFSPSSVRSFWKWGERSHALMRQGKIVSIGPSTSEALRECGVVGYLEASEQTEDGVIRAIAEVCYGGVVPLL